jgi:adenylate kinase
MSDAFEVVYLTGAPATGKSTLVERLKNVVEPIRGISYSKLLADYLTNRDQRATPEDHLRQHSAQVITPEDVNAVDDQLIAYVSKERQQSHIIIDSHPVTKERYGYRITAFSVEKLRAIQPSIIVMLYTEPDVVIRRIAANSQGRPQISPFEAQFHSEVQASVAATYGILLGVPVYLLDSSQSVDDLITVVTKQLLKNPSTRLLSQ